MTKLHCLWLSYTTFFDLFSSCTLCFSLFLFSILFPTLSRCSLYWVVLLQLKIELSTRQGEEGGHPKTDAISRVLIGLGIIDNNIQPHNIPTSLRRVLGFLEGTLGPLDLFTLEGSL
jgi:hypothetical protein